MYIFGSECSATLVRDKELTALPYTLETLREEKDEIALDPLVGYILPLTIISSTTSEIHILGCVVTRVCNNSVKALAVVLLFGNVSSFAIYLNRIAERRIYLNLLLTGFEVRADLEEPLYIRLDVEGNEAIEWDYQTPDIKWEQKATLEYRTGDITLDGITLAGIYRFALTRINGDSLNTILQLHYALADGHPLNNHIMSIDPVGEWVELANQDEASARYLLKMRPLPLDLIVAFAPGSAFLEPMLLSLNDFSVVVRYPSHVPLEEQEAIRALEAVKEIRKVLTTLI